MDTIDILTRRGRQHRAAIESCKVGYEGLPESQVRHGLLVAADKASRALECERKYRAAGAPPMPAFEPYVPPWPKTLRQRISIHKRNDDSHIRAKNPSASEPVIKIRLTAVPRLPRGTDKQQMP